MKCSNDASAVLTPIQHPLPPAVALNDLVIYEFPLNERARVLMRLEQLFLQADHFMQGASIWDSRAVIATLLEILAIFSRNDLKSEILKEVERHVNVLQKMADKEHIDQDKLGTILDRYNKVSDQLYATSGKIGQTLTENELFKSIAQRSAIPGGTCPFDLPAYHYWLEQDESVRKADLEKWLQPFDALRLAIGMVLRFFRQSSSSTLEQAQNGFFQRTLDHSLPYQLLRVGISRAHPCFAEISGGKHRFTIRFMTANATDRPTQSADNISFQLTCCVL
jgi:cell division protein ZapD